MGMASDRAASVMPPSSGNKTEFATVTATASAAKATGVGTGKRWLSVVCDQTWNITFGDVGTSTVTDPTSVYYFLAGQVLSFELNQQNTHFKVKTSTNGNCAYWLSSRE